MPGNVTEAVITTEDTILPEIKYILKWELYRMTTQSFRQNISRYFLNKIKSLNKDYD